MYPNFFSVLEDSANVLMFRLLADTLNRQFISLPSFYSWPFNVKLSADIQIDHISTDVLHDDNSDIFVNFVVLAAQETNMIIACAQLLDKVQSF